MICSCGGEATRATIHGPPVWFCPSCSAVWGFWSWTIDRFGFGGRLLIYARGYWRALWRWITLT